MRVLLFFEDDAEREKHIVAAHRAGIEQRHVETLADAENAARDSEFDAVVVRPGKRELALKRFFLTVRKKSPKVKIYTLGKALEGAEHLADAAPAQVMEKVGGGAPRKKGGLTLPFKVLREIAHRQTWRSDIAQDPDTGASGILASFETKVADAPETQAALVKVLTPALGVQHPLLAGVHESVLAGATPYVFWSVPDGTTLTEVLARAGGKLEPQVATALLSQLADALGAVHAAGLFHGAFDGDAVWVTFDGSIRLLHLGIGWFGERGRETRSDPRFPEPLPKDDLAPEQVEEAPPGAAIDAWRAGLLLYQMLLGEKPFAREDAAATLRAITTETPAAPAEKDPKIPVPISELALKLLAREPAGRPPSGAELAKAVERAVNPGLLARLRGQKQDPTAPVAALMKALFPPG